MNREQKAAVIEEIAGEMSSAQAIFAVDYRGISVPQVAELRAKLREADASFRVVKNTLTQRAADRAGVETLKQVLEGPTALTFVRGDAALAAKAISDYGRQIELLAFKGGLMEGQELDVAQIQAIAKLPARDVLHGQLVGTIAAPITGLVRGLNALISGIALQLGQIAEQGLVGQGAESTPPLPEEPDQDAEPKEPSPPVQPDQAEGEDTTESENDKPADTAQED